MKLAFLRSSAFLASILFATSAVAQIQSFPTAQGAGALARGDVEYEVYEVTNLNASGPGSLWDALGDNRIVVFRVSGIINIPTNSTRSFRNLQVLGQTAPAPGVTIVASGWRWSGAQNAVFRYLRWRTWQCRDDLFDPCGVDNVDVAGLGETNTNLIFDHCSFAFGGDEFLSFRGDSHTATVQNSLFSYGKTGMLAGDSNDYTQGYDFSILSNFWHTIGKRTPNPNSNGRIDVIGNVSYNILNLGMRTGGSVQLNEIGNHYIRAGTHRLSFGGGATPLVHTSGNRFGDEVTANGQDNSVMWEAWQDGRDPQPSDFTDTAFPLLNYMGAVPDGDDSLLAVRNRERGANAYLSDTGSPIRYLDALDEEAYDQFDAGERFDWDDGTGNRTQAAWELIPQRRWLTENEPSFGVVVNEHDQGTHAGVVPHVWIEDQGLEPDTFDPLGNDLDAVYTNIEVYSFGVDGEPGEVEPGDAGPGPRDAGPRADAGPGRTLDSSLEMPEARTAAVPSGTLARKLAAKQAALAACLREPPARLAGRRCSSFSVSSSAAEIDAAAAYSRHPHRLPGDAVSDEARAQDSAARSQSSSLAHAPAAEPHQERADGEERQAHQQRRRVAGFAQKHPRRGHPRAEGEAAEDEHEGRPHESDVPLLKGQLWRQPIPSNAPRAPTLHEPHDAPNAEAKRHRRARA